MDFALASDNETGFSALRSAFQAEAIGLVGTKREQFLGKGNVCLGVD